MDTKAAPMKSLWLEYLTSFVFSSLGRIARDLYFADRARQPLPRHYLLSAALYSGVTGMAIAILLMWWKPDLQGSPLIIGISLLAGIGAVDLADVVYSAFRQWARKAAGLPERGDEDKEK